MDVSASGKTFLVTVQLKDGLQTYRIHGKDLGAASRAVADRVPGGAESIRDIRMVDPQGGAPSIAADASQKLLQAGGTLVLVVILFAVIERCLRNWLLD